MNAQHTGEVEDEDEDEWVIGKWWHIVDNLTVAMADKVQVNFGDVDVRKLFAEEGRACHSW